MLTIEIFQCLRKVDRFYEHITLSDIPVCSIFCMTLAENHPVPIIYNTEVEQVI